MDLLLRFYNFSMAETLLISQIATQNSLALACEQAQDLLPPLKGVHLGSGDRHVVKVLSDKVIVSKKFRVFQITDNEDVGTMLVRIEAGLGADDTVVLQFKLKMGKSD